MTQPRSIPAPDTNLLWANSGGLCGFPECAERLVTRWAATDGPTTLGRRAHIRAHSPGGPRHDPAYPTDLLDRYPNLVLLCSPHHDIVDRYDSVHTIEDLERWKEAHERWVAARLRRLLPTTPTGVPPPLRHFVEVEDVQLLTDTAGVVVLTGPAGSGKTALASEVYHRHGQRFDIVWWVRCARRELLAQDVVDLVALLTQTETPPEPEDAVRQLHGLLARVENALVILDGLQDLAVAEWLVPPNVSAHVIATTQRADGFGVGTTIHLGGLPSERSQRFLAERLHSDEGGALDQVAEVMESLPLALEQAASYMINTAMAPADYLELLTTRTADVLERGVPTTYGKSVIAAVALSLDTLSSDARDVIQLVSHLSADNIPLDLLIPADAPRARRCRVRASIA